MTDFIIKVEGLLKEYHIYDKPVDRLKEIFSRKTRHRAFKALGPLDIQIRKGETLGIIGENGAGKSTFLKLVARVIEPSFGNIDVYGKVSAILELGTGFNPEFTGRENVLLNGTLLGLTTQEIMKRMNAIERFADIGEFFDMPVKTYSTGMYLRVAFSLAVNVDADIIVIDEALAVGDGLFEKKCIDRIWELKRNNVTILFCSHSLYTISNFCDRVMWLKEGKIEQLGETKYVISMYEDYMREKENLLQKPDVVKHNINNEIKIAEIRKIEIRKDGKEVVDQIEHGSDVELIIDFEIYEDRFVQVGFAVDRNDGLCCYANSMQKSGISPFKGLGSRTARLFFERFPLLGGVYKFVIFLLDETGICIYDRKESNFFKVNVKDKEWGVCFLPHKWEI
jgi:teichoic acid transport system ATP-binding protein